MKKEYTLAYGKNAVTLELEEEKIIDVLRSKELPSPENEEALIREAMANPIGTSRLTEIINANETVCIVIGDITRLWIRHHVIVKVLLEELNNSGIADEQITIISARGSHRNQTTEEIKMLVGDDIYRRIPVIEHTGSAEDLVDLGHTSRNTPVRLNRHVVEADRVILTGGIVHHYLAGYGGGKKSVLPGVSSREGIMANHKHSLNPNGPGLNPDVRAGKLQGNPLSEDMVEAGRMLGVDFIVNILINDQHKIALAVAGDLVEAHEKGCALADEYYGVPIREKADLVIASCGGYPKDINMYQTYKASHNMVHAMKKGGVGILVSQCCDGIGSDLFYNICTDFADNQAREQHLSNAYDIAKFAGYTQLVWTQQNRFIAISDLPDEQIRCMGMTPVNTLEEALTLAQEWLGDHYKAYIMPEGATTFPMLK
ncbi:nickel-dependent lactate racemase [Dethiobacter alkaliphilus]|uniref:Uncharacterized protein n=1 Tax=Dethiobacter alkaliphilus AHT 1 TaxID=555088 RepID=C0GC02_DETAL|nr:nickel-dependent lactate racemase [Dethiobacter alkaliphilus]EEG78737.1 conserved hypothetical protein [Dethiobacter alkaliphilus AHT 1]